jgi:hypothetical protein
MARVMQSEFLVFRPVRAACPIAAFGLFLATAGAGLAMSPSLSLSDFSNTATYRIQVNLSGLEPNQSVTFLNNGNKSDPLRLTANGTFSFTQRLLSGAGYNVTVESQPSAEYCEPAANPNGTVGDRDVTVKFRCTPTYVIGGELSGLESGKSIVLKDTYGSGKSDSLTVKANGAFHFGARLAAGTKYTVTIATQPAREICTASSNQGVVRAGNVSGIRVACAPIPQDFSIAVAPSSVSAQMGTTSTPVKVSITGLHGFSGSVSVGIDDLPAGVTCSPSCPLTIRANSSAQISLVVAPGARTGSFSLAIAGASGRLSHKTPLSLTVTSSLQAYWNFWQFESLVSANPAPVGGKIFVSGWAFEGIPLTAITIFVDNKSVGNAFYGTPRPDVESLPGAFEDCGFSLALDTTKLSNGLHTVTVSATDSSKNVTPILNFPNQVHAVQINVNNPAPPATGPIANLVLSAPAPPYVAGTIVAFAASATNAASQAVSPAYTWSSTNPAVAKVTPTGTVFLLAAGSATVSVSAGGQTKQAAITVTAGSGTPGTIQTSVGPEEVVLQYNRDACMEGDYSDNPARAVRLSDGSIFLNAGTARFRFADFGADFYSLARRCSPIMVSADNWSASSFANEQWIMSLYSDGTTIHALVHNEYHDPIATTCKPGNSTDGNPCQYTSITYATSTDDGRTFTMSSAPQNTVAPPPVQWTPPAQGQSPFYYGYQEPTNIVHAADGYYYARFGEFPPPGQPYFGGNCEMRTETLSDPSSWRAWDGTAFELQMTDPYTGPSAALCSDDSSGKTLPWESLTFNTYLNMYMLVGLDSDYSSGSAVENCGFHFALSADLLTWSTQQLIAPAYVPAPSGCQKPGAGGFAGSYAYASIIDPDDPSTNFETPGRTAYIYYTRFNDNIEDRDLARVPVLITKY